MNRYFITTIISLLLVVGSLQSQSFEGTVNINLTKEQTQEISTMLWHKQNTNSRLDITTITPQLTYTMSLLMEDDKDDMTMLVDMKGKKSAYKSSVSRIKAQDEPMVSHEDVETGEEEERNGYNCKVMTVKGENGKVKYWLTNEIDIKLTSFPPMLQQANYYKYLLNNHRDMIPVLVQSYNADGTLEYTQEIVKVSAEKVDGKVFVVSDDYEWVGQ